MSEILRTENGEAKRLPAREAMREIDHAMMSGKRDVDEMYGAGHNWFIRYRGGREVRFTPLIQRRAGQ